MIISVRGLRKTYRVGEERVHALRGLDLDIQRNEFVAIMGASGSGKSTLMNILGCLDRPTAGGYMLNKRPTHKLGAADLAAVRNKEIGFVFQSFELLSRASALKNVALPLLYSKTSWLGARKRAQEALEQVGLGDRMHHRPNQLSGGQRQRVAIARALVNNPAIILADEPTGNLDSRTGEDIMRLFDDLHEAGQTIVIVTHEEDIAGRAARIVRLRDGRVLSDCPTDEDPQHRQWLESVAAGFQRAASETHPAQAEGSDPSSSTAASDRGSSMAASGQEASA